MIKHMSKTYHLGGIIVNDDIDMNDCNIMNLSRLCFDDKWSLVINDTDELCICYEDEIRARISNTDFMMNLHCERYFMFHPSDNLDDCIGLLVSNTSKYYNTDISQRATTEALPVISISNKAYDKSIVGVIVEYEKYERNLTLGNIESVQEQKDNINRVLVTNKGTAVIWVSDINGPLTNGDYITTSEISGYGMKQKDDIKHNYTGPKITQDCYFNPQFFLMKQAFLVPKKGHFYDNIYTDNKEIITDVEYEIKYLTKTTNIKTAKDFEEEIDKISRLVNQTEPYTENGILKDEIWYHKNRTIFRIAKVGCCF